MIASNKVYKSLNSTEDFVTMKLTAETADEQKALDSIPLIATYLSSLYKGLRNIQKHGDSLQFIASK